MKKPSSAWKKFGRVPVEKRQWHMPGKSEGKGMVDFPPNRNLENEWLIYQDDFLLIVNKPSGLRTIPDGYNFDLPHLTGILTRKFGRLWTVHRLDKETSGILLFARNPDIHRNLNLQFERREISKIYHAIAAGSPPWQKMDIELPLRVNGDRKHRTVIDQKKGKPAVSTVEVIARYSQASLLTIQPKSGYTHQIRTHLAAVGFPILFDPLYNPFPNSPFKENFSRLALHALQIKFVHPKTETTAIFKASYPQDFVEMLAALNT
jgi:tRNA pseudouridine32 synthase / 23S rRNA pseudouridine746 synthase